MGEATKHPSTREQAVERRPIPQRESGWAKAVNARLVRSRITPNQISVVGMLAAIGAGVAAAFIDGGGVVDRLLWLAVAAGALLRLLCNMFDGMAAVERGAASPVGELYNEAPDRVSDAAILIGCGYAATGDPVAGFSAAVAAVFVAYVRALGKAAGAPNDFVGPMAKPQRMWVVMVVAVFLALTPTAWRWPFGEMRAALWLIAVGCVVTAIRRLVRAARALRREAP